MGAGGVWLDPLCCQKIRFCTNYVCFRYYVILIRFKKSVASKPIRIRKHPIFNLRLKESELKSNTEAISLRALYWLSPTSCVRSIGPLPSPLSSAEVDKKQKFHWKDLIRDGPSFF